MKTQLLAMWSGPRNISTAMMRSWGNRSDCVVLDEPFYAWYLKRTGQPHPGASEIIASQPTRWQTVVEQITALPAGNAAIYYQKHITTHMLPEIELDWLSRLTHCFLIRSPDRVVASYNKKRADTAADDLGYAQQFRLFEHVCTHINSKPLVIDTELFLRNPEAQLKAVCAASGIQFQANMLSWEPGIRDTDGIWHRHWYDVVKTSTGFKPYVDTDIVLTDQQRAIADDCRPYYEELSCKALKTPN